MTLPQRLPPPLPWRAPRFEWAILVLMAIAVLTPIYNVDSQDIARICLTRSLVHFRVSADSCLSAPNAIDKSRYDGHLYSDKAPGMSVIEIPSVEATRLGSAETWSDPDVRLWLVRLASSGVAFLLCAFMVGRISEGLAPGRGGMALVVFGLGTLFAPLAAANFEHVTAGTLGLGTFVLAWRRRPGLAGLAAGVGLCVAYESALIATIVGIYLALQGGRALGRYIEGFVPGAALLLAYNWLAFGRPWHFSYGYIVGQEAKNQSEGFFGLHAPYGHAVREVFVGSQGLFVSSPILIAAGVGLVLMGRRYGPEAIVCALVTVAFLFLNCGYFLPYGGDSPGPRFLVPCLPFLALGLGPAFAFRFRTTTLAAAASVVATTGMVLTWVSISPDPGTIWTQIVKFPFDRRQILEYLSPNILDRVGLHASLPAGVIALAAAASFVVALAGSYRR